AKIDASLSQVPAGGMGAKLFVNALDYRDGAAKEPLLALDSFRVKVDRLDLPGRIVAIDEVSLAGLETSAEQDKAGTLKLLGLMLAAPVEAAKDSGAK